MVDPHAAAQVVEQHLGIVGTIGVAVAFMAAGQLLPGLVVRHVHEWFEDAKDNPWMRDPAHPKRAKLLVAVAEFLEDAIPDRNSPEHDALYTRFGKWMEGRSILLMGTGPKWAALAEKVGDALDTDLPEEIIALAKPDCPPPTV